MVGSTECALIWREKVTPAGASISRLAPWTPPISEAGCGGALWPTPKASNAGPDFAKIERSGTGPSLQTVMAGTVYWPTPKASAAGETSRSGDRKNEPLMGGLMRGATWPTVTSSEHKYRLQGDSQQSKGVYALMIHAATWVTPTVAERVRSPETLEKCADFRKRNANQNSVPLYLGEQMAATAPSGPTPTGSPATTARRGAPNPAHPCWLMGYPVEWLHGAASATQSSRKSRRK